MIANLGKVARLRIHVPTPVTAHLEDLPEQRTTTN